MTTALHPQLPLSGRLVILAVAFLGWLCAGVHMSITQMIAQPAAIDLLDRTGRLDASRFRAMDADEAVLRAWKEEVARWYAWYQCAFLFGAAGGGLVFGWLGDRLGRSRGMSLSILTYSALAGAAYFSRSPEELLVLWFLACLGVGGMWPNGVALVSEAWAGLSRPAVAGLIGAAANIGIFALATLAANVRITPSDWRWVLLVGAAPVVLGLFSFVATPESPGWRAARAEQAARQQAPVSMGEVFRPPLLGVTLVGIVLATTPLIGGWGTANWMIPWADRAGEAADPPNPFLKAHVQQARALTGILGSVLGGWIASAAGRRRSYFLTSLASLLIAQYVFWALVPTDRSFLFWVAALGFVSGVYFGWMPLCLPELFPTRVRSTGAGVSFNFGRIVTAGTIFATGAMMHLFAGDYARIGRVASCVFLVGMTAILFAPDTSRKQLAD
jgi:MFS family permease